MEKINKDKVMFFIALIIGLLVLSVIISSIIFTNKINTTPNNNQPKTYKVDKNIIAIKYYYNYASGVSYNGSAIFNDGTIYNWTFNGTMNDYKNYTNGYDIKTMEGLQDFILNKGEITKKIVSKKTINKINSYINNIEEKTNIDLTCNGADMGTSIASVIKNNKEILLSESGDCNYVSNQEKASKLLSIINKYISN